MSNIDELKSTGLKATLPRIKILEVFQQSERRHLTAEDVYKTLLNEGSDIGLATVYRVLMQFEQAGLPVIDRLANLLIERLCITWFFALNRNWNGAHPES